MRARRGSIGGEALMMRNAPSVPRFVRAWKWWPVDALIWFVSVLVSVWARYDFSLTPSQADGALTFGVYAVLLQTAVGLLVGIYVLRFIAGSFDEAIAIAFTGTLAGSLLFAYAWALSPLAVPRSTPLSATAMAMIGMLAARFVGRAWTATRRQTHARSTNVVVFGAGAGGIQLVRHMKADRHAGFRPVALLDDDPAKGRLQIAGVRVRGTQKDLAKVAERSRADTVVIAIPTAEAELIREVTGRAEGAGLRVLVLPPLGQLVRRKVGPGDLRDINVNDLLGRHPVTLDEAAITSQVAGRRVLVTGAGGSIGSELCRQILRFQPAELIMLDRDESALHAVQLSLYGRAMLDGSDTVLADIRDARAVDEVFARHRPEIVFHAAALKHLPLLEAYPLEAWKTNVVGTLHVLNAARKHSVSTFMNISTDKAADPCSVLGYSKRVAERLTAAAASRGGGKFVSVRFGNVLGSRGSVLTTFERQIADGGPVTVTHPDVTRYFMTISEACQLVLQAASSGRSGEVLVLDMGEPIRILEVAKMLIGRADRSDLDIVFTGLRRGEKMHEDLFATHEPRDVRPAHHLISHVPVQPLSIQEQDADLQRFSENSRAVAWMVAESSGRAELGGLPLQERVEVQSHATSARVIGK